MANKDKLVSQAQPHLESGEPVVAAVMGAYEAKIVGNDTVRNGVMLATDRRIVFYAKKLGGYELESFPIQAGVLDRAIERLHGTRGHVHCLR
jgi:hypothetical protein